MSDYARRFAVPVHTGVEARSLQLADGLWRVTTDQGGYEARSVVVATGIMSAPQVPGFVGLSDRNGRVIHSSSYRNPAGYPGQRVLVAGVGNSGAEIASELAEAGAKVSISVRSGANVVPRSFVGIPTQYFGWALAQVPSLPVSAITRAIGAIGAALRGGSVIPRTNAADGCPDVPLIGVRLVEHVRSRAIGLLPGLTGLARSLASFADGTEREFDRVVLATGYRAAIDCLGEYGARDKCGFALRRNRVQCESHGSLYFIGHNYDGRGGYATSP